MNERSDLASVQNQVVELLGRLRWRPSSLRVQVGDVTVEIAWPGDTARPAAHGPDGHLSGPFVPVDHASLDGHASPVDHASLDSHADGPVEAAREYLTSPAVGVFYHAKEPGAEPFIAIGSTVEPGQQVGIVEAMKLMIPVEADRAGVVVDVLTANGAPVEYDEPLFALATADSADTGH